eukprot:CAMPEP_0170599514 /NCGR_PEP_ID=MMETSP0224-20130122/16836_1 /TAXON_ID=285029 /ORGANISM="Togula jolla, Strain CCCM 725" /LENGTH=464 /DNA_ID=CAMNT_0010924167 /DNA_START=17 /DNA_END=1411 /DNA_ORIENTATION=+
MRLSSSASSSPSPIRCCRAHPRPQSCRANRAVRLGCLFCGLLWALAPGSGAFAWVSLRHWPSSSQVGSVALAGLLAVAPLAPVQARDGSIAPPTCVSIVDAATNCPPRQNSGSLQNAEAQLRAAESKVREEGGPGTGPTKASADGTIPVLDTAAMAADFWRDEVKRLSMNKAYLEELRSQFRGKADAAAQNPPRLISRLEISAADVQKEVNFWCEAIGMQKYASLPDGGAVVAFGPPGLASGDEGGYFSLAIRPASSQAAPAGGLKLSFVQVATPSLIRISKVFAAGGELVDGYGYYGLKSPAGVQIRGYVDDRRDPVEFVALVADSAPDALLASAKQLESLGLEPRGPYKLVSPITQEYMPTLPVGSVLYGSGDAKQSTQILLQPATVEQQRSIFEFMPTLVVEEDQRLSIGMKESPDTPQAIYSEAQDPRLVVLAPKGTKGPLGASGNSAMALELREASEGL